MSKCSDGTILTWSLLNNGQWQVCCRITSNPVLSAQDALLKGAKLSEQDKRLLSQRGANTNDVQIYATNRQHFWANNSQSPQVPKKSELITKENTMFEQTVLCCASSLQDYLKKSHPILSFDLNAAAIFTATLLRALRNCTLSELHRVHKENGIPKKDIIDFFIAFIKKYPILNDCKSFRERSNAIEEALLRGELIALQNCYNFLSANESVLAQAHCDTDSDLSIDMKP
jgi:hypothetical protein